MRVMKITMGTPVCITNSVAPIHICDNGGWTDTWFAEYGAIFNIGIFLYAEPQQLVQSAQEYGVLGWKFIGAEAQPSRRPTGAKSYFQHIPTYSSRFGLRVWDSPWSRGPACYTYFFQLTEITAPWDLVSAWP